MPIVTKDYTITSQMTGKITIENLTHDKHRHNFEIAMVADKNQLTSKLGFGDKAIAELTKSLESSFDIAKGKVTLKASIAAHANVGLYEFDVEMDAPNHLKAEYKPKPISAIVEKDKRKYKFVAEIAFKVDVTLHPSPPKVNPEAREKLEPNKSSKSMGLAAVAGLILAYITWVIYGPKGPVLQPAPGSSIPILYSIDPNNLGPSA